MTTVSLIIPTYNRAWLLPQTLACVLEQTYPHLEIIVVNDGSTDETQAVLAGYAGRVKTIHQENQGETAARNAGIAAATGDYFTFLDDDDIIFPDKIARQVQLLQTRPNVDVVYCRYYHMDVDGRLLNKTGLMAEGDVLPQLVYGNFIGIGAPLLPRRCVETIGLFDADLPFRGKYSEDWDWFLRLALAGFRFACIQEPLCAYRVVPTSQTANVASSEQGILAILDKLFAHPQLPQEIAAAKNHIYAVRRLWISGRYYAAGQWADGQRNLQEALTLQPQWCADPTAWLDSLFNQAFSYRVADPIRFIHDTFAHLPPEMAAAQDWPRHQNHLLSRVYNRLALDAYHQDDFAAAQEHLSTAIRLNPALLVEPERFAAGVGHTAMHLPLDDPRIYAAKVLGHLPPGVQQLTRMKRWIYSYIHVASAFEAYALNQRGITLRHVVQASYNRPAWLKNRGVLAIFLKALLGRPAGPHQGQ